MSTTSDLDEILFLAKEKLGYKDPNISLSKDEARFKSQYTASVGSYGLYTSSRGDSFDQAIKTLLENLRTSK